MKRKAIWVIGACIACVLIIAVGVLIKSVLPNHVASNKNASEFDSPESSFVSFFDAKNCAVEEDGETMLCNYDANSVTVSDADTNSIWWISSYSLDSKDEAAKVVKSLQTTDNATFTTEETKLADKHVVIMRSYGNAYAVCQVDSCVFIACDCSQSFDATLDKFVEFLGTVQQAV